MTMSKDVQADRTAEVHLRFAILSEDTDRMDTLKALT